MRCVNIYGCFSLIDLLGCFIDQKDRVLNGGISKSSTMTLQTCKNRCVKENKKFYGLEVTPVYLVISWSGVGSISNRVFLNKAITHFNSRLSCRSDKSASVVTIWQNTTKDQTRSVWPLVKETDPRHAGADGEF